MQPGDESQGSEGIEDLRGRGAGADQLVQLDADELELVIE